MKSDKEDKVKVLLDVPEFLSNSVDTYRKKMSILETGDLMSRVSAMRLLVVKGLQSEGVDIEVPTEDV